MIVDVITDQAAQVPFIQRDDVIEHLAAATSDCGSRKLNLRALGCSTTGFPIQHTWHARLLRER
jgi:hypothetical protein